MSLHNSQNATTGILPVSSTIGRSFGFPQELKK